MGILYVASYVNKDQGPSKPRHYWMLIMHYAHEAGKHFEAWWRVCKKNPKLEYTVEFLSSLGPNEGCRYLPGFNRLHAVGTVTTQGEDRIGDILKSVPIDGTCCGRSWTYKGIVALMNEGVLTRDYSIDAVTRGWDELHEDIHTTPPSFHEPAHEVWWPAWQNQFSSREGR